MRPPTEPHARTFRMLFVAILMIGISSCGGGKGDERKTEVSGGPAAPAGAASISGTITVDPALKDKVGAAPLLMIMASGDPDPSKPALVVKRIAGAKFPYDYKITAEDITLVGSSFEGKMYVTARIDPAGMVGPPHAGTFEGTYSRNPVSVDSTKIDIVINKSY